MVHAGSTPARGASLRLPLPEATHAFRAALADRDAEGAVRAALALELSIVDLGDEDDRDTVTRARAELRSMISSLGDAAVGGVQDPREVVGPFVEAMLGVIARVRPKLVCLPNPDSPTGTVVDAPTLRRLLAACEAYLEGRRSGGFETAIDMIISAVKKARGT